MHIRDFPRADLHLHTVSSDGLSHPVELIEALRNGRISYAAITDHDTDIGYGEAETAAEAQGVRLLRAVECSAGEGEWLHILGYGIRGDAMAPILEQNRQLRRERASSICLRLRALGMELPTIEAQIEADEQQCVGRLMIARALVENGHADDVDEAFARYIGRRGCAFVPQRFVSTRSVLQGIRDAGGVPVLAHPGRIPMDPPTCESLVMSLRKEGLAGIEVWHPSQDERASAYWERVANRLDLLATGGSDFHGRIMQYDAPAIPSYAVGHMVEALFV